MDWSRVEDRIEDCLEDFCKTEIESDIGLKTVGGTRATVKNRSRIGVKMVEILQTFGIISQLYTVFHYSRRGSFDASTGCLHAAVWLRTESFEKLFIQSDFNG